MTRPGVIDDPVGHVHLAEVPEVMRPQKKLARFIHQAQVEVSAREKVLVSALNAVESVRRRIMSGCTYSQLDCFKIYLAL